MKIVIFIIAIFLFMTIPAMSQNYIGMTSSKIIKRFGKPDRKGDRYIVYNDPIEDGTNTYYFDENDHCIEFIIVRSDYYYSDYKKMLKSEFIETLDSTYISKTGDNAYMAILTKQSDNFRIKVIPFNIPGDNNKTAFLN